MNTVIASRCRTTRTMGKALARKPHSISCLYFIFTLLLFLRIKSIIALVQCKLYRKLRKITQISLFVMLPFK